MKDLTKGLIISFRKELRKLAGLGGSPARKAVAVGLGVTVGLLPIAPLQTLTGVALAFLLRLNRVAVFAGTLVWQPFTAPFILAAEYSVGGWLFGGTGTGWTWSGALWRVALGGGLTALAGGVASGILAYLVFTRTTRQNGSPSV